MKLSDLLTTFNAVAPEHLAGGWDKVGLHAGSMDQDIEQALMCIDLTHAVITEALKQQCQLILADDPPIFAPLQRPTDDGPWNQTRILRCAK